MDRAETEEAKFRSAHTLSRPLHQSLVAWLVAHERVIAVVEAVLGPRFVCWSAHLFCKLPGDPTEQPWHQDAGFWPLTQSRALTLWLAFDDVDAENAAATQGGATCRTLLVSNAYVLQTSRNTWLITVILDTTNKHIRQMRPVLDK